MVRLRFLYLLSITIALALVMPVLQNDSYTPKQGKVLAAQNSSKFIARPGMPDPNEIYRQVNTARLSAGLQPLERNDVLANLAESRAQDMSINNYYAHKNPQLKVFSDILADEGYKTDYSCENLNLDFTLDPSVYIAGWLKSSAGHRECMLNPEVTEAGYAVAPIVNNSTQDITSYVVVAIHSTPTLAK